jgi:hypothetical protein
VGIEEVQNKKCKVNSQSRPSTILAVTNNYQLKTLYQHGQFQQPDKADHFIEHYRINCISYC